MFLPTPVFAFQVPRNVLKWAPLGFPWDTSTQGGGERLVYAVNRFGPVSILQVLPGHQVHGLWLGEFVLRIRVSSDGGEDGGLEGRRRAWWVDPSKKGQIYRVFIYILSNGVSFYRFSMTTLGWKVPFNNVGCTFPFVDLLWVADPLQMHLWGRDKYHKCD